MTDRILRSIELEESGQLDAALAELDAAIQEGFDPPRAHYQRGLTLTEMGRLDDAIEAYRAAIELRPDYLQALVNLAMLYMARQDAAAAAPLMERAGPLAGDDDAVFLTNRAMLYRMTGKPPLAIGDAERATQVAPDEAGTWVELGQCYLLDPRRLADSIRASRRALELSPGQPRAAHNLAAALDRAGEPEEALVHANAARTAVPDNPTYTQTTACILLHLRRPAEAMPLLEAVVAERPDDFEAQYNLACGLSGTGHPARAIEHIGRAIELVPPQHRQAFRAHLRNDPDLEAARGLPAFHLLLG